MAGADRHLARWLRKPFAGAPNLIHRIAPRAMEMHDLGAVDQTLTAVDNELGLRVAPVAQSGRPLLGTPQIEHLRTPLDHRAVDIPGRERRHLPSRNGDHRLVEQRDASRDLAEIDQAASPTHTGESPQLRITEAVTDTRRFREVPVCARGVTFEHGAHPDQVAQIAPLDAIQLALVQEAQRAIDPTATARQVPLVHQTERQPESATGSTFSIAQPGALLVSVCPDLDTLLVVTNQVGSRCEPLKIIETKRTLAIGDRQPLVRSSPSPRAKASRACSDPSVMVRVSPTPGSSGERSAPAPAS